jgi:hypothetical protein
MFLDISMFCGIIQENIQFVNYQLSLGLDIFPVLLYDLPDFVHGRKK